MRKHIIQTCCNDLTILRAQIHTQPIRNWEKFEFPKKNYQQNKENTIQMSTK